MNRITKMEANPRLLDDNPLHWCAAVEQRKVSDLIRRLRGNPVQIFSGQGVSVLGMPVQQ